MAQGGETRFINGIGALVELLHLQAARDRRRGWNTAGFVSGYRGSPLAGLDQALLRDSERLTKSDVLFKPGLNEELAATAVWGSQQTPLQRDARREGVFALWYAKAPGVERSTDALRHANAAGVSRRGGVLALLGDDHACKSSTLPSASEVLCRHIVTPLLSPANVQEVLDFGLLGWELSRASGLWVSMKCLIDTMDASARVIIDETRVPLGREAPDGDLWLRLQDSPLDQEARFEQRLAAAHAFARRSGIDQAFNRDAKARIGIVATGKSWLDVNEALGLLGLRDRVALYKVGLSWPLEPQGLAQFARGLEELIIVEEKASFIEAQARELLYDLPAEVRPRIVGKSDETGRALFPARHELEPTQIARLLGQRLVGRIEAPELGDALAALHRSENLDAVAVKRSPYFCAGCPHSSSTKVPEGSRALAGIGCHYMAQWMDRSTETFAQMGGEGAAWIGQAPFVSEPHVFANLGDGTYAHSGTLAIRAAIAARVNITYKILFNGAVAMTGGQSVEGEQSVRQIVRQLKADGVSDISVVSEDPDRHVDLKSEVRVLPRADLESEQQRLREIRGVTVIVFDQACATERRRRRKRGLEPQAPRRVFIAKEVCEGCGDCGVQSNCVAIKPIETELGRKREIDQSSCNQDTTCVNGFCPSFVTIKGAQPKKSTLPPAPDPKRLPAPCVCDEASIVIAGVGGTGVVTLGAILGHAADSEALGVTVLDMIGMAQKGGQVLTHLRLGPTQASMGAYRIPVHGADLLLGCDALAAASPEALKLLNKDGAALVAVDETPIGEFTRSPDWLFPTNDVERALQSVLKPDRIERAEAHALARAALGDAIGANLILLGVACQRGYLPLGPDAIEEGIRGNGVSVEFSLSAFRWGRFYGANPNAALSDAGVRAPSKPLEDLSAIVADRRARLVAYQDKALAQSYADLVGEVAAAERRAGGGDTIALAAARQLYKVLAYKDEYEVARLLIAPGLARSLNGAFEGELKLEYNLAPPLMAPKGVDGIPRKLRFGAWLRPFLVVLAQLKGLRKSRLDPFGWTEERRAERALASEYSEDLRHIVRVLATHNLEAALDLAESPSGVRGYGHVKAASMSKARRRRDKAWKRLNAAASAAVES